jgi:hypothetical protein
VLKGFMLAAACAAPAVQVGRLPVLASYVDGILEEYFSSAMPPPPMDDAGSWSEAAQVRERRLLLAAYLAAVPCALRSAKRAECRPACC